MFVCLLKPLHENVESYETVSTSPDFLTVVELLFFGLFGLANQREFSNGSPSHVQSMTKVVFGLYNVLIIIVLINLLIAMMSDTYQRLQEQSDVEWKFGRAKLIRNMERETSNPTPINVFSKLIHVFKMLYRTRCQCRNTEIGSEPPSDENGSIDGLQRKRKTAKRDDALGEGFYQEWSLIYSVVDWETIVEKYMDSKGETEPKRRGRGQNNRERRRNKLLAQAAQAQGNGNQAFNFHDVADTTIVKMNVVNSLKI